MLLSNVNAVSGEICSYMLQPQPPTPPICNARPVYESINMASTLHAFTGSSGKPAERLVISGLCLGPGLRDVRFVHHGD